MNRRLLDPFQAVALPEKIEEILDQGHATCVELNRWGTLMAAGCLDGTVLKYDFITRGVHHKLQPHKDRVVGVSWSRTGYFLASASESGDLSLWNVLENRQEAKLHLGEGMRVTHISLAPRAGPPNQACQAIVSLAASTPVVVDFYQGSITPLPTFVSDEGKQRGAQPQATSTTDSMAVFDRQGRFVFVAQARGSIAILYAGTFCFLEIFKFPSFNKLTSLTVNRKGNRVTVTCPDRTVRVLEVVTRGWEHRRSYSVSELRSILGPNRVYRGGGSLINPQDPMFRIVHECSLPVDKVLWQKGLVTSDMEHILAAPLPNDKDDHLIYVWERGSMAVARVLQGPKGGVLDMAWHPTRNLLVSVSVSGEIFIWSRTYRENWSAFAPDFEELTENQEYEEAEDEFDINGRDDMEGFHLTMPESCEDDIDIVTNEEIRILSSDDEEDERGLHHLPADIIPERPPSRAVSMEAREEDASASKEGGESGEDEEMVPGGSNSAWEEAEESPSEGDISIDDEPQQRNRHNHAHLGEQSRLHDNGLMNGVHHPGNSDSHLLPGASMDHSDDEELIGSSRQQGFGGAQSNHQFRQARGGYIDQDDFGYAPRRG